MPRHSSVDLPQPEGNNRHGGSGAGYLRGRNPESTEMRSPSRFPQALPYLACGVALSAALLGLGVRVAFGQTPRAALTAPNVRGVRPAFLLFSTKSSSVEREFA